MTIEGAIVDLQNLIDSDGIPFWAKPSLQKVMETVEAERERNIDERKTGKWISEIVESEDWRGIKRKYFQPTSCSVCHNPSNIAEEYPYCPHCGAEMKGGAE